MKSVYFSSTLPQREHVPCVLYECPKGVPPVAPQAQTDADVHVAAEYEWVWTGALVVVTGATGL